MTRKWQRVNLNNRNVGEISPYKILASLLFHSIKMGADRIRQIVQSLRNFSRLDQADIKAVDLHEGIDNT